MSHILQHGPAGVQRYILYLLYLKSAIDAAHIDIDKRRKKYIIYIHTHTDRERE